MVKRGILFHSLLFHCLRVYQIGTRRGLAGECLQKGDKIFLFGYGQVKRPNARVKNRIRTASSVVKPHHARGVAMLPSCM